MASADFQVYVAWLEGQEGEAWQEMLARRKSVDRGAGDRPESVHAAGAGGDA